MAEQSFRKWFMIASVLTIVGIGTVAYANLAKDSNATPITSQGNSNQTPNTPPKAIKGDDKCGNDPCNMDKMDHSQMDLGPADEFYDLRFIDAMIPHHEGAVKMAQDVLQKSQRAELQQLANDVIKAQNTEIAQMQQWRKTWYADAPDVPMAWHRSMNHMMAMSPAHIQAMRMEMDLGKADSNYDLRFINAMIPHHEGAVKMAQDVLQKSQRREVRQLAENIIKSQEAEIKQMKEWRKAWYGI
ncbi:MAG: DUF305 domain-containing protein [Pseudanabaenaceae cyanobacterium]